MIIRKFTAPTMTEALRKVRDELGTDAIILSTRTEKKGGVLDFMGSTVVEVTAAVDNNRQSQGRDRPSGSEASRAGTPRPVTPSEASLYPPGEGGVYSPPAKKAASPARDRTAVRDMGERLQMNRLMDEITELKQSIRELADSSLAGELAGLPGQLQALLKRLRESGMDERIAKRLVRQLLNDLKGGELADAAIITERAAAMLRAGMGKPRPIVMEGQRPRIIAFVGPTGSGKTTTIAKLATDMTMNQDLDVAILTVDTRRVDAVGQLKAYCRIINIPLFIAYSPEELPGIMPGVMQSDVTLVDTPGSGPMDKKHMFEMVEFLHKLVPQEVHLTLSVTTSLLEMKRIHENFSVLKPNRMLFTKLDETMLYGPLVSFALMARTPMSYATFGQNVPGDFSVADPDYLVRELLRERE